MKKRYPDGEGITSSIGGSSSGIRPSDPTEP